MKNQSPAVKAARRSEVTNSDLIALMREGAEAADRELISMCNRALNGSKRARAACTRLVRATRVESAACPD